MRESFRAHTGVHLKFLARSRVLLGFGLCLLGLASLNVLPMFFVGTISDRFTLVKQVADVLHGIAAVITAGLGLLVLWTHLRMRAIKLVATRPGSFDVWVASIFAAAALFGLVAHATVAAVVLGLSLYWNVPYQAGFAYVALQWFAQSAIVLSYLTALAAVFHPVIAILVLLFVNDAVLRGIQTMLAAAVEAGHTSKLVHGLQSIATALYYVAPTFTPFAEETSEVNRSLHVAAIDLQYLAGTFGYAALVSVFGFLVTLVVLRRRRLT